ncbi:unnamed protein product [Peniophora sp. CBMAI 1063]|nr:unnamed protein product [Peniophora sp. CBMAI 1063]
MTADEPQASIERSRVQTKAEESDTNGAPLPEEAMSARSGSAGLPPQPELLARASQGELPSVAKAVGEGASINPHRDYYADLREVLNAPSEARIAALKREHYERYGEDPIWTALLEDAQASLQTGIRIREQLLSNLRQQLLEANEILLGGVAEESQRQG